MQIHARCMCTLDTPAAGLVSLRRRRCTLALFLPSCLVHTPGHRAGLDSGNVTLCKPVTSVKPSRVLPEPLLTAQCSTVWAWSCCWWWPGGTLPWEVRGAEGVARWLAGSGPVQALPKCLFDINRGKGAINGAAARMRPGGGSMRRALRFGSYLLPPLLPPLAPSPHLPLQARSRTAFPRAWAC